MNGISMQKQYALEIITGMKLSDYRKGPIPKNYFNQQIYLLCEGQVLGEIIYTKHKKLQNSNKWIWSVQVIEKYDTPKLYYHPINKKLFLDNVIVTELNSGPSF